jgi:hypothetical protein
MTGADSRARCRTIPYSREPEDTPLMVATKRGVFFFPYFHTRCQDAADVFRCLCIDLFQTGGELRGASDRRVREPRFRDRIGSTLLTIRCRQKEKRGENTK